MVDKSVSSLARQQDSGKDARGLAENVTSVESNPLARVWFLQKVWALARLLSADGVRGLRRLRRLARL